MNINNKYLIPAAIVMAGVLVAGTFVYINYWPKGVLSSQQAAEKAIAFINQNIEQGATAALIQVIEENNVYKISLKINETPYESYITKDGKFLFPSGINLQESTSEATTESSEEQSSAVASDAFTQCLTEKGMKFYGSKTCSWCNKEKELLGASFQYVAYVECIDDTTGGLTKACQDAKIESFPTWQLPDNTMQSGYQTLEQLAEVSGCSL